MVRGTQLAQMIKTKVWSRGAKEVHVRLSCPPLMFGCPYLNSTRNDELIARRVIDQLEGRHIEDDSITNPTEDVNGYLNSESGKYIQLIEAIRKEKGFTSLRYQRILDMVSVIGLSQNRICTYCWNGES